MRLGFLLLLAAFLFVDAGAQVLQREVPTSRRLETLQSVGGLPADLAATFREPLQFQQAVSGQYFVFDQRGHTVFGGDADTTRLWKIVQIGHEEGRIIEPTAFDMEPNGNFVVADAPAGRDRIQLFAPNGSPIGGFTLPNRSKARITFGGVALSGIGSLQYTGRSVLINQPETGALITEYGLSGTPVRTIGRLRKTGYESDRELHLAFNAGLPLVDPRGGFYFVFQAGVPLLQKYDAKGTLVFERHIEGRELDELVASQPTTWPRRKTEEGELALVMPTVRTAAVDRSSNLWISFVVPYTYVYNPDGDKVRTVQFRAAGIISPSSLFFSHTGRLLVTPGCYEFKP
ncbi:MAG: hypothetical protein HYS05_06660 [Acidobacteria bacterium]|nr:hypothetical protein [Acidobacteriota bacterium]